MPKKRPATIGAAYEIYRFDAQARRLTDTTLDTYTDRIEPFINWCVQQGKPNINDVDAPLLRAYLVSLQERDLSSSHTHRPGVKGQATLLNAKFDGGRFKGWSGNHSRQRRPTLPHWPTARKTRPAPRLLHREPGS
jgi:hypothetical protein